MEKTNFIKLVKTKRKELDLSQKKLSRMCGFSNNAIFQYESGVEPTLSRALIILKKLRVSVDKLELITDDGFIGGSRGE